MTQGAGGGGGGGGEGGLFGERGISEQERGLTSGSAASQTHLHSPSGTLTAPAAASGRPGNRAADGKESMFPASAASGVRLSPGKARAGMGQGAAPVGRTGPVCVSRGTQQLGRAKGLRRRPKLTPSAQWPPTRTPPRSRAAPAPGGGLKKCQGARTQLPGHWRECACNLPSHALNRAAPARETAARPTAAARLARAVQPLTFPRPLLCPPQYFSGTSHSASRSEIAPTGTALLSAVPYKEVQGAGDNPEEQAQPGQNRN
ncbi:unnamed protein product [Caretta caretta]